VPDVFISYSREDRSRVEPLVAALQTHGWDVWWDRRIEAGSTFDREIEAALADAHCIVVVWSRRSIESDWVRAEATDGLERRILVPLMLDDVRTPLAFRRTQAISSDDQAEGYASLIRAVDRVVNGVSRDRQDQGGAPKATFPAKQSSRRRYAGIALLVVLSLSTLAALILNGLSGPDASPPTLDEQRVMLANVSMPPSFFVSNLPLVGRDDEARELLDRLETVWAEKGIRFPCRDALLASFFLRDEEGMFRWLDRAIEQREVIPRLYGVEFDELRRESERFRAAMARMGNLAIRDNET